MLNKLQDDFYSVIFATVPVDPEPPLEGGSTTKHPEITKKLPNRRQIEIIKKNKDTNLPCKKELEYARDRLVELLAQSEAYWQESVTNYIKNNILGISISGDQFVIDINNFGPNAREGFLYGIGLTEGYITPALQNHWLLYYTKNLNKAVTRGESDIVNPFATKRPGDTVSIDDINSAGFPIDIDGTVFFNPDKDPNNRGVLVDWYIYLGSGELPPGATTGTIIGPGYTAKPEGNRRRGLGTYQNVHPNLGNQIHINQYGGFNQTYNTTGDVLDMFRSIDFRDPSCKKDNGHYPFESFNSNTGRFFRSDGLEQLMPFPFVIKKKIEELEEQLNNEKGYRDICGSGPLGTGESK